MPFRRVVEHWLDTICGCGSQYVGIRYPPPFVALIADVAVEHVLPLAQTEPEGVDDTVVANALQHAPMHPVQSVSRTATD